MCRGSKLGSVKLYKGDGSLEDGFRFTRSHNSNPYKDIHLSINPSEENNHLKPPFLLLLDPYSSLSNQSNKNSSISSTISRST
jgi:hypothetical protein